MIAVPTKRAARTLAVEIVKRLLAPKTGHSRHFKQPPPAFQFTTINQRAKIDLPILGC
jgi:hypothetical protein